MQAMNAGAMPYGVDRMKNKMMRDRRNGMIQLHLNNSVPALSILTDKRAIREFSQTKEKVTK